MKFMYIIRLMYLSFIHVCSNRYLKQSPLLFKYLQLLKLHVSHDIKKKLDRQFLDGRTFFDFLFNKTHSKKMKECREKRKWDETEAHAIFSYDEEESSF